jgi:HlyD family secretion protein
MDRDLSEQTLRRDRFTRIAKIGLPLIALGVVLALLPGWMRPSINRSRIRLAQVTTGSIDAVVTASGSVVPAVERVLASPVDARLLRVLKRPGEAVRQGDPVAELDLGETTLAFETIVTNGRISDNEQERAKLALTMSLADLDGRIERQDLDRQMLAEKAGSSEQLFKEGLVSQQALREARLAVRQAELQLAQLRRDRDNATRSAVLQAEQLALQRSALALQAGQARRQLELGTTRSDRDGVVTWVLSQEGSLVRRGEVVARIADLSAFRVDATVSDVHAARIRAGAAVKVTVNATANAVTIDGTISDVQPTVEGGIIRFTVALTEPSHAALRPSLGVDVLVVTDHRARALKVRQGTFPEIQGVTNVYVVRNGRVYRTPVTFGLRGFDEVEVVAGLSDGDEIVISDMRDYAHLQELEVQ